MSALKSRLLSLIKDQGPITVAEYMSYCLLDPVDGYYPTRDPLGSDGDFITAPEISQMFGEVLGLWALQAWQDMGRPETCHLIELGPGRGIMMADMLRSARLDPDFLAALSVTLIEASAALEAVQARTLAQAGVPVNWAAKLEDVADGPSIIIGNEFLDCLPIRQLIQKDPFAGTEGWHERLVITDPAAPDQFRFGVAPIAISKTLQASLPKGASEARQDELLEICPASTQILDLIKTRFDHAPGRALFIDYGPEETEFGDTLQALKRHEKTGVFSDPGNTDLTARVDFAALIETAQDLGLTSHGPTPQQEFLSKLGIEVRAVALSRAKPEAKEKIARQLHRLMAEDEMGQLFKAVSISSPNLPTPLGFRDAS